MSDCLYRSATYDVLEKLLFMAPMPLADYLSNTYFHKRNGHVYTCAFEYSLSLALHSVMCIYILSHCTHSASYFQ